MAKTHYLKSWTQFFTDIKRGRKLHDLRKDDRGYEVGDLVVLQEYDMKNGAYTGDACRASVTYITNNKFPCAYSSAVLPHEYCILSLKVLDEEQ